MGHHGGSTTLRVCTITQGVFTSRTHTDIYYTYRFVFCNTYKLTLPPSRFVLRKTFHLLTIPTLRHSNTVSLQHTTSHQIPKTTLHTAMAPHDGLPFFLLLLSALLTMFATAFAYFLIQLWRVRSFFKELQNRGLVNHPKHRSNR